MRTPIDQLQHKINNLRQRQWNMSELEKQKAREIQRLIVSQAEIEDDIMIAEYDLARMKGAIK